MFLLLFSIRVSRGLLKVFESSPALWLAYASSLYNAVFRLRLSSSSSSFSSRESVSGHVERDDEEEEMKKNKKADDEERGLKVVRMEVEREDDRREEVREEKRSSGEVKTKKKAKQKKTEDKKGGDDKSNEVLHSARKVMLTCSTAFSHSLPLAASWCHLENLLPLPSSTLSSLLSRPLSGSSSSSSSFSHDAPFLSSSIMISPSLSPQQVLWLSELRQSSSFLKHTSLGTLSWLYRYLSSSFSTSPSFFHNKSEEKRRRTRLNLPPLVPWEGQGVSLWSVEIACCAAEEDFESLHHRLLLSGQQTHESERKGEKKQKKEKDNEEGEEQDVHGRRGEGERRKKVMTRREEEDSPDEAVRIRCTKAVHTLEKKLEKFLEREEDFLSSLSNCHQDEV